MYQPLQVFIIYRPFHLKHFNSEYEDAFHLKQFNSEYEDAQRYDCWVRYLLATIWIQEKQCALLDN